ncbi:MAG: Gfo/Idh/MocA family protein [Salinibacter sp.]
MSDHPLSRRDFLTQSALGASAVTIVPREVLGGEGHTPPSDMIRVGAIGVGGKGETDVRSVANLDGTEIAALCDVDEERAEDIYREFPDVPRYEDYRELIAQEADRLDAVTVSTPDHNHAPATIRALEAGLHVFCQKPLTHTVEEARQVGAAAETADLATQMGIQHHAHDGLRTVRELLEAGAIGTVREVHLWTNRPIWPQAEERPLQMYHVPDHLSWNLWLGPAEKRPYHPDYAPFTWRGWKPYGTGALGDMGCHYMDAAFWALQLDAPSRIKAETTPTYPESYPAASRLEYEFPARNGRPAVTMVWRDGNMEAPPPSAWPEEKEWPPPGYNEIFVGDDGVLLYGLSQKPRLLPKSRHEEVMANPPEKTYERSPGIYQNWIQACRGKKTANTHFPDYAAPLTETVLLGNVAVETQRPVEWDAEAGRITNRSSLNKHLKKAHRSGWAI